MTDAPKMVDKMKQSSAVKAAVISGLFLLVGACCTVFGGLISNLIYHLVTTSITPKNIETYPLHTNPLYGTPSILFVKMYNQDYAGAVPKGCVQASYGDNYVDQLEENKILNEAQRHTYGFDLVTDQSLIVTSAEVFLENYQPPPSEKDIRGVTYYDPPGMGGVPSVLFPESTLNKSTTNLTILRKGGSLRLDPGNAITIVIPLIFSDPGLYHMKIVIHSQLSLEHGIDFTSEPLSYGWMYLNNITNVPIKTNSGTKIEWLGPCP